MSKFIFILIFVSFSILARCEKMATNKLTLSLKRSSDIESLILELENTSNDSIVLYGYRPERWMNYHFFDSSASGVYLKLLNSQNELMGKRPSLVYPADDPPFFGDSLNNRKANYFKEKDNHTTIELDKITNEMISKAEKEHQIDRTIIPPHSSISSILIVDCIKKGTGLIKAEVYYQINSNLLDDSSTLGGNVFVGSIKSNSIIIEF